jgi:hypothetical protein
MAVFVVFKVAMIPASSVLRLFELPLSMRQSCGDLCCERQHFLANHCRMIVIMLPSITQVLRLLRKAVSRMWWLLWSAWWGCVGDGAGSREIVTLAEARENLQHEHQACPQRL